ncbi:MAG: hypothetical protein ACOCZ5_03190 [bacterium]
MIKREYVGKKSEEIVMMLTGGEIKEKRMKISFKNQKRYKKCKKIIHMINTPIQDLDITSETCEKYDIITKEGKTIEVKSDNGNGNKFKSEAYVSVVRMSDSTKTFLNDRKFLMENLSFKNFVDLSNFYNKKLEDFCKYYNQNKLNQLQKIMEKTCDYIVFYNHENIYFYYPQDVEFSLIKTNGYNYPREDIPIEYNCKMDRIFVCCNADKGNYFLKTNVNSKYINIEEYI